MPDVSDSNPENEGNKYHRGVMRQARANFTLITGYTTDPAWYRFRRALEELNLIPETLPSGEILEIVRKAARIRKELPQAGIPFKAVLSYYLKQEELVKQMGDRGLSGGQLEKLIRDQGVKLPTSTRSNWFKKIGGFAKNRTYRPEEIQHILFLSAVYLGRKEQTKK